MILPLILTVALAPLAATAGVDCFDLVDHYHKDRFDHPTDGMPEVFPGPATTESLSYSVVHDSIKSNTDLVCDAHGTVERLRFSYAWEGERDPDKTILTEIGMIVLAAPFAPDSGLITELFERADASLVVEQMDLPGPYLATVEVSPFSPSGGAMTLVVERDQEPPAHRGPADRFRFRP
jgi:hypothetical protein